MVGCTIGSREEAPGERKPVIRGDNNNENKTDKIYLLIDVAIPSDRNVTQGE